MNFHSDNTKLIKTTPVGKFENKSNKQIDYYFSQKHNFIPQDNEYNSWSELLQKVKLFFNEDFKYNQLLSLKKYEYNSEAYLHLGQSLDFGLDQWINHSTARTHLCIFNDNHNIQSLDIYFVAQLMIKKEQFIFIDYDVHLFKNIFLYLPIDSEKIVQFDLTEYCNSTHCISFSSFKKSNFIDFFQTFFNHDNDYIKNQFCLYVGCVIDIIHYLKENPSLVDNETLQPEYSLSAFLYFGQLNILKKYQSLNKHCEKFLNNNQFEELIESSFLNIINQLLNTGLFNPNKPAYDFLDFHNSSSQVFILTQKNNYFHYTLVWSLLKNMTHNYFEKYNIYQHTKEKYKTHSIFFHNPIIPLNIEAIPSQLRAIGSSLVINFDNDYQQDLFTSDIMNHFLSHINLPIFFKTDNEYMKNLFINSFSQHLFISSEYKNQYKVKHHVKDLEKLKPDEFFTFFKGSIQKIKLNRK